MTMTELVARWYAQDETHPPKRPDDLWGEVDEFIATGDPGAADDPFPGGRWNLDDVYDAVCDYWNRREGRESGDRPTSTTAEMLASARAYADAQAESFRFMVSELIYESIVCRLQSAYIEGYRARIVHELAELRAERDAMEEGHD